MKFVLPILALVMSAQAMATENPRCTTTKLSSGEVIASYSGADFRDVNDQIGKQGRSFLVVAQKTREILVAPSTTVLMTKEWSSENGYSGIKYIDLTVDGQVVKTVSEQVDIDAQGSEADLLFTSGDLQTRCLY